MSADPKYKKTNGSPFLLKKRRVKIPVEPRGNFHDDTPTIKKKIDPAKKKTEGGRGAGREKEDLYIRINITIVIRN